jgi:hypothetical protein
VSGSFISQNFDEQSIGTGTADGNNIGGTLDGLIELLALGNDSDASGTIHSMRHQFTGRVAPSDRPTG